MCNDGAMRRRTVGRDTTLCMSLSGRPGTFGSRFQNSLYEALGLDWVYKAFTTTDLAAAIGGIRALGIRGCAVSMPFKEACIPLLDNLAPSADAIQSVNTIVNDAGKLTGHNTDYGAVGTLLRRNAIPTSTSFAVLGSGGMAKAVASALRDAGLKDGLIVARNAQAGRALADSCGYTWQAELGDARPEMLINVTPIGMAGGPEVDALAFPLAAIEASSIAFDVVAVPVETPFVAAARAAGKKIITGADVIVLQALGQFLLYTGVEPTSEQVAEAADFALGVTRAAT
jgi:shikimate dehydrogenase